MLQAAARPFAGTRLAFQRPVATKRLRARAVTPYAGYRLVPTGDGSCEHLDQKVAMPEPIKLTKGLFELGREDPADIVVPLPTISARHAMLRVDDGSVTVTDLDSTNGTYIDGRELVPMRGEELPLGAEVTFGDQFLGRFALEKQEDAAPPAEAAPAEAPATPSPAEATVENA
ncbi:hypothetical protein WJX72_011605 [[Myrmecia] bisecta]|uniref:FHA domain-containing protein n=1 Tax=[Myrmecia] bisecta TaxID=41462 RepID=A0AAW1QGM5_9CHLO